MSAADIDAPEHAGKCVVRITSRPSTLEEDEWALIEVHRVHDENVGSDCAVTCILIAFAAGIGSIVGGIGWSSVVAGAIIGIASCVLLISYITYLLRKARKPQVTLGKPLGEIVTVSVPVRRVWKSLPTKYYDGHKYEIWVFEIAPHILVRSRLGKLQSCDPLYIEGFVPSSRMEIDYYTLGKSRLVPGRFSGLILTIRSFEPIEYEAMDIKQVQRLPARLYDLDGFESAQSEEPENWHEFEFSNMGSLIWDLRHPFYADTCHVIDDRPA